MNNRVSLLITILIVMLLSFTWAGCSNSNAESNQDKIINDGANKKVNVKISTVSPKEFIGYLQLVGEVESENDATISGQVAATTMKIVADKGKNVQSGDTILVLDNRRYKAFYDMARASYENAQIDFDIAKKQYDEGLGVSETQFKKVQNGLLAAEANMLNAKVDYDNCFITAPFDAIVAERYVNLGEMVNPGVPLIRLVDNQKIRVKTGVPEKLSAPVREGTSAIVKIDDLGLKLNGKIKWVGATLESRSRTLPIEIDIKAERSLKPGMVVEVVIEKNKNNNAIVLPLAVLQKETDHYYVYVYENGKAVHRRVEYGEKDGDNVEIINGLNFGDEVIFEGYRDLVDMQDVEVVGRVD